MGHIFVKSRGYVLFCVKIDCAASIVQYLHLDETERPITTLPMNYTYGLSIINSHLMVGATILLTEKGLMQKEFWTFFKEQEATSFGGVPYTYEMLERLRFFRMDLPSLRYFTQAGGKLAPERHRKFAEYAQKRGKKFVVMYGQTEATARMGYLPPERALDKCGSMGVAIPGGRMWLRDVDGSRITEPRIVGELLHEKVKAKYDFRDIQGINKLTDAYRCAAGLEGVRLCFGADMLLTRAEIPGLYTNLMEYKGNSGFFLEYDCEDIMELRGICDDRRCQTLAYFGDKKMLGPLLVSGIHGVDRVVPIGRTMEFDLIWDGMDLVERLSRHMCIY